MTLVFNQLATELGFQQSGTLPTPGYYFHGCLADAIAGIVSEGLRVNCQEPCLTLNPASALWKYANPASHSRNIHSGRVWNQVQTLIAQGVIGEDGCPEELLAAARRYWRECPTIGAAFVLDLRGQRVEMATQGKVTMTGNVVHGGISKWIYAHLTLVPDSDGCTTVVVAPHHLIGYLKPAPGWNRLLNLFHPLRVGRIPSLQAGSQQAGELLRREDTFQQMNPAADLFAVAQTIVYGAAYGFLYQELRKLLLACAAIKGATIVKDDVHPAEIWPTANAVQTCRIMDSLQRVRYADPPLGEIRDTWLDRLRRYLEEPDR